MFFSGDHKGIIFLPQLHWQIKELSRAQAINSRISLKKIQYVTTLVVQWLGIHLPVQGTWVGSLVWEDPTRYGGTEATCHSD